MVPGRVTAPAQPVSIPGWLLAAREFLNYLCRRRRRVVVVNKSMQPWLNPGDFLLVNPLAYSQREPMPGDIVVAYHPHHVAQMIVKRVGRISSDHIWLSSDNASLGQDSRQFGAVTGKSLVGKVTVLIPGKCGRSVTLL